jgi:hypothetical protein
VLQMHYSGVCYLAEEEVPAVAEAGVVEAAVAAEALVASAVVVLVVVVVAVAGKSYV